MSRNSWPPGWRHPEGRPKQNLDHEPDREAAGKTCSVCSTPAMHWRRRLGMGVCCKHYWELGYYCIGEHM